MITGTVPGRIESSKLRDVRYNAALRVLDVEFRVGGGLRFLGVPPEVFDAWLEAASPARFFRERIRFNYPTRKLRRSGVEL